jgi:chromosome segregation ATPase
MEKFVKGKVRIYQKNIKKKLKEGTNKTYETIQQQITIKGSHKFKDGDNVVILKREDYNKLYKKSKTSETVIKELNDVQERYGNLQRTNEDLVNEINRLRNKHDHLKERLRASLEEINTHQKVINDLSNRGFLDYVLGRQPKSVKMLGPVKNEHKKPNIPDTKREW